MRKKGQTLINKRIKSLRKESSHTQQQLAEKLGIKNQTVSCYESGEREPSYEIILKLADYFNVSVDYLLGRTDVKTPNIDMIAIHKQTGLSEEAIKTLKENYENWPDNTFTKTLNVLIGDIRIAEIVRREKHVYNTSDSCVCCGAYVPEGTQVCRSCRKVVEYR